MIYRLRARVELSRLLQTIFQVVVAGRPISLTPKIFSSWRSLGVTPGLKLSGRARSIVSRNCTLRLPFWPQWASITSRSGLLSPAFAGPRSTYMTPSKKPRRGMTRATQTMTRGLTTREQRLPLPLLWGSDLRVADEAAITSLRRARNPGNGNLSRCRRPRPSDATRIGSRIAVRRLMIHRCGSSPTRIPARMSLATATSTHEKGTETCHAPITKAFPLPGTSLRLLARPKTS